MEQKAESSKTLVGLLRAIKSKTQRKAGLCPRCGKANARPNQSLCRTCHARDMRRSRIKAGTRQAVLRSILDALMTTDKFTKHELEKTVGPSRWVQAPLSGGWETAYVVSILPDCKVAICAEQSGWRVLSAYRLRRNDGNQ